MRSRCAIALALAGACGCTADPVTIDVSDRPGALPQIKGGYEAPDDTGVMAITSLSGGSLCSGSLIAPNVILTARHCVSGTNTGNTVACQTTTFDPVAGAGSFFVSSAQEVSVGNAGEFLVSEVVPLTGIPGVPGSVEDDTEFCGNDMAVLILDENVPESVAVPYEPLLEGQLDAGLAYYAVGYGAVNGSGDDAGKRRRLDDLTVQCDGESACLELELEGVADGEWSGNGGVCSGDSGGPALDLDDRVVGVTSRGDQPCDLSVYANPSAHAQWLRDTTVFASGMGLYEAPAWTAGANVDPEFAMPVGELCQSGDDCPTGICVKEKDAQYCSRPCSEDGPCPEGYECTGEEEMICTQERFEPPPTQKFKRGESDGCSLGRGRGSSSWLALWLMTLYAARRRRSA